MQEVQRCHNPDWIGTPHYSTKDCVYHGHFLPKNTSFIINSYAISRDPVTYPKPDLFQPERHLNTHTSPAEDDQRPVERNDWTFGAGRRICPGEGLSERVMFLAVSHTLWAFTIQHAQEGSGPILESDSFGGGSLPPKNQIMMVPRDDMVEDLVDLSLVM
ncbi:O-methylsterigmatocystin oxidoreductase [Leucoagaricus sp. SymC.cos]|nr:O-methylsterigmatocystin oxidoreductase [Leucoagaricus sp. SymC.cos]